MIIPLDKMELVYILDIFRLYLNPQLNLKKRFKMNQKLVSGK